MKKDWDNSAKHLCTENKTDKNISLRQIKEWMESTHLNEKCFPKVHYFCVLKEVGFFNFMNHIKMYPAGTQSDDIWAKLFTKRKSDPRAYRSGRFKQLSLIEPEISRWLSQRASNPHALSITPQMLNAAAVCCKNQQLTWFKLIVNFGLQCPRLVLQR